MLCGIVSAHIADKSKFNDRQRRQRWWPWWRWRWLRSFEHGLEELMLTRQTRIAPCLSSTWELKYSSSYPILNSSCLTKLGSAQICSDLVWYERLHCRNGLLIRVHTYIPVHVFDDEQFCKKREIQKGKKKEGTQGQSGGKYETRLRRKLHPLFFPFAFHLCLRLILSVVTLMVFCAERHTDLVNYTKAEAAGFQLRFASPHQVEGEPYQSY